MMINQTHESIFQRTLLLRQMLLGMDIKVIAKMTHRSTMVIHVLEIEDNDRSDPRSSLPFSKEIHVHSNL